LIGMRKATEAREAHESNCGRTPGSHRRSRGRRVSGRGDPGAILAQFEEVDLDSLGGR
jgi:hypothetical protein